MSFMDLASDWYSATVSVIIYAISYTIEPRYNGTRMYLKWTPEAHPQVKNIACLLHVYSM